MAATSRRRRDRLGRGAPGWLEGRLRPLAPQAFQDFALERPLDVSLEQWESSWLAWPEGMFLAVAGRAVIGCAGLEPRRRTVPTERRTR